MWTDIQTLQVLSSANCCHLSQLQQAVVLRHFLLGAGYALNFGSFSSPIPEMYKRLVMARHNGLASSFSRGQKTVHEQSHSYIPFFSPPIMAGPCDRDEVRIVHRRGLVWMSQEQRRKSGKVTLGSDRLESIIAKRIFWGLRPLIDCTRNTYSKLRCGQCASHGSCADLCEILPDGAGTMSQWW